MTDKGEGESRRGENVAWRIQQDPLPLPTHKHTHTHTHAERYTTPLPLPARMFLHRHPNNSACKRVTEEGLKRFSTAEDGPTATATHTHTHTHTHLPV
jgi:hypothetical protein